MEISQNLKMKELKQGKDNKERKENFFQSNTFNKAGQILRSNKGRSRMKFRTKRHKVDWLLEVKARALK